MRYKVTFFIVCFDVPLGNRSFFNQSQEMFPLTSNLMRYETYATKYCREHWIQHLPEMDKTIDKLFTILLAG